MKKERITCLEPYDKDSVSLSGSPQRYLKRKVWKITLHSLCHDPLSPGGAKPT